MESISVKLKNLLVFGGLLLFSLNGAVAKDSYYYDNNKKVGLIPLSKISRSITSQATIDFYQTEQGHEVGIYNKILLKIKAGADVQLLLAPNDMTIEEQLSPGLYLIVVPSNELAIDLSNRLSEQPDVEYAHPDFIKKRISR